MVCAPAWILDCGTVGCWCAFTAQRLGIRYWYLLRRCRDASIGPRPMYPFLALGCLAVGEPFEAADVSQAAPTSAYLSVPPLYSVWVNLRG